MLGIDSVDHQILLTRLQHAVGIHGIQLTWLTYYLTGHTRQIQVDGIKSISCHLTWFSFWTSLFSLYIHGSIIRKQLQLPRMYSWQSTISWNESRQTTTLQVQSGELHLRYPLWMSTNVLKLNYDKTEFIIFGTRQQLLNVQAASIEVGRTYILPTHQVRHLGVVFETTIST